MCEHLLKSDIRALEHRIAKLEAALEPFAPFASRFPTTLSDQSLVWGYDDVELTAGDFRRASEALEV